MLDLEPAGTATAEPERSKTQPTEYYQHSTAVAPSLRHGSPVPSRDAVRSDSVVENAMAVAHDLAWTRS